MITTCDPRREPTGLSALWRPVSRTFSSTAASVAGLGQFLPCVVVIRPGRPTGGSERLAALQGIPRARGPDLRHPALFDPGWSRDPHDGISEGASASLRLVPQPGEPTRRAGCHDLEHRCLRCGACVDACPWVAGLKLRQTCTTCGLCVKVCPSGARQMVGRRYQVEELTSELLRDGPDQDRRSAAQHEVHPIALGGRRGYQPPGPPRPRLVPHGRPPCPVQRRPSRDTAGRASEPRRPPRPIGRVAGYSDDFCDLSRELQVEIISRTEHVPG